MQDNVDLFEEFNELLDNIEDPEVLVDNPDVELAPSLFKEWFRIGLLCKWVIHSGSHQACKSLHHSQTGLFGSSRLFVELLKLWGK